MKSAVWLPGARRTARHLLWVPKLSYSQCMITPIYEQLLDARDVNIGFFQNPDIEFKNPVIGFDYVAQGQRTATLYFRTLD